VALLRRVHQKKWGGPQKQHRLHQILCLLHMALWTTLSIVSRVFYFDLKDQTAPLFFYALQLYIITSLQCVVTSYDDDSEEVSKTLPAGEFSKTVMPLITAFLALEKRLKTMNKGRPLPVEMVEFLEENMSRSVVIMSTQEMLEMTSAVCAALQLDKPETEQVSISYALFQFGTIVFLFGAFYDKRLYGCCFMNRPQSTSQS
jgi:hypothetical protein